MSFNNHSAWVILSNSNTCRIYDYRKKNQHLTMVHELNHPENRLRDIEITTDKPGSYKGRSSTSGRFEQESDPKAVMIDNFAREIAHVLDKGRNEHAYEKLILIAEPHMSGLLLQHMNKHVKNQLSNSIPKDLVHLKDKELLDVLHNNRH